jgi:hypothetical protein
LGNALIGNWSPPTITTKKYDKGSSTLSNMGNTAVYETVLNIAYVTVLYFILEQRRFEQSLVLAWSSIISNFLKYGIHAIILETAVV